jgi:hypothetical protein
MGLSMRRKKKKNPDQKTLCVDFDGVIHSYTSGWQGATVIGDPPVRGALQWLDMLINHDDEYKVCIYSSRSKEVGGIEAMQEWFFENGFDPNELEFPTEKPSAWLTIDDRAICFRGTFPLPQEIDNFKPWYK